MQPTFVFHVGGWGDSALGVAREGKDMIIGIRKEQGPKGELLEKV